MDMAELLMMLRREVPSPGPETAICRLCWRTRGGEATERERPSIVAMLCLLSEGVRVPSFGEPTEEEWCVCVCVCVREREREREKVKRSTCTFHPPIPGSNFKLLELKPVLVFPLPLPPELGGGLMEKLPFLCEVSTLRRLILCLWFHGSAKAEGRDRVHYTDSVS